MKNIMGGMQERSGKIGGGGVQIGKLKKESVHIDGNGNIIDPRTKQIIQRNTDRT